MKLATSLFLLIATGPVAAAAIAAKADTPRAFAPGMHKVLTAERVSGVRRSYFLRVPAGYDGSSALPVVLAVHGAFSTARELESLARLGRLADRDGFLVIYPQGIGLGDFFRHWNSGHCCGKARTLDLDDVGFALGAVDDAARRIPLDRGRLYVMGHSNGGMLAYRIAAEHPEAVAAVAVVSGTIGGTPSADEREWEVRRPARPVPVLAIHGRADESIPYDGGRGGASHGTSSTISVARSIALWVDAGRCAPRPAFETMNGGPVQKESWSACADDAEVVLYSLDGWGHEWPDGAALPGFDATEIIWQFFKSHRRDA